MGIPELWKELGDGEITSLAHLSASHFTTHARSFRIAIDEAGWRFNNLTEAQVYAIQQKSNEPAYRGIEKNCLFRLAKLLRKNIQPLFVFDGPGKPWKGGKVSGRPDYERVREMKELFTVLRIPYHTAPGEAEAECAKLQMEGIVDAVWSEDADALMFGAELLIRDYRVGHKKSEAPTNGCKSNSKKSGDLVRVYRMDHIRRTFGLDREGLVCFAVLSGGDYDRTGLNGCGARSALQAARHGLGKSLCAFRNEQDLRLWRSELVHFFKGRFDIPTWFPKELAVKNYCRPKVTPAEELRTLRGLRDGWEVPFNEKKVQEFISTRFNMWTKSYMDWIGPILLVRSLLATPAGEKSNKHDIKLTRRRKKKDEAEETGLQSAPHTEIKLTFSAKSVTSLDYDAMDDGHWLGKVGVPDDREYRPECEILHCFLRRSLPGEIFLSNLPKQRGGDRKKRKADGELVEFDGDRRNNPAKKRRAIQIDDDDEDDTRTGKPPKKRGRPRKEITNDQSVSQATPLPAPPAVFRLPTSTILSSPLDFALISTDETTAITPSPKTSSMLDHHQIALDNEDSSDGELGLLNMALELSKKAESSTSTALRSRVVESSSTFGANEPNEDDDLKLAIELSMRESYSAGAPQSAQHVARKKASGPLPAASRTTLPHTTPHSIQGNVVKSSISEVAQSSAEVRAARLAHFNKLSSAIKSSPTDSASAIFPSPSRTFTSKKSRPTAMVIDLSGD